MSSEQEENHAGSHGGVYRYRAFLSYSHADRRWGRWLMRKVETYRVPDRLVGQETKFGPVPALLSPLFRDRDELSSAGTLTDIIEEALRQSEALIVIASPASARSRWVNEEVMRFKRSGRQDRIHCFIVDGDPEAEDDRNCFVPALRFELGADGELSDRPIELVAADARAEGDGRQRALTRLVAGLLGVRYDDLRQRELVRRNRRLMAIAAISTIGMAAAATLAGVAFLARQDAERRRVQAEDLVGFMLGDLYERLYEIDRVDIYNTIGDKATEYFASLEEEDLTDSALAHRSESLRLIGETRADQGQLDAALEAFELALGLSEGIARRHPDRADWWQGLAETHYWIGYVAWRRGDLETAAAGFKKQLEILQTLLRQGAIGAEVLLEMGYAYTNLGRVEESLGRLGPALVDYQRVLSLNRQFAEERPDDVDARLEIGFANNNLGLLLKRLGRLEEAEQHFREDWQIKRQVADEHPGNGLWRQYALTSETFLGEVLEYLGYVDEALEHYASVEEVGRREYLESPDNHSRARSFANKQRKAGELSLLVGRYDEADRKLHEAEDILVSLRAEHEEDLRWLLSIARAQVAVGRLALERDDITLATSRAEAAHALVLELLAGSPDNSENQRVLMTALLLRGDVAARSGDPASATQFWEELVADMAPQVENSRDPEWLEAYVAALARLDRMMDAERYLQRLRDMDYRRPGPMLALMRGEEMRPATD